MKFRVVTESDPRDHVIVPQSLRTLKDVKKIATRNGNDGGNRFAIDTRQLDDKWVYSLAFAFFRHHFAFEKYKTSRCRRDGSCSIVVKDESLACDIRKRLKCQWFANRLATEPANKMTPDRFCQAVEHKFKGTGARIKVMDTQELKKRGFGLILSVGQSSVNHPPRFLIVEIGHGPRNICLVGKGVIFDSGGYNLKGVNSMTNMKGDKTGGALAVAAAHYFTNRHDLAGEFKIVALVPLVENLIGQNAQLVGDVHTSYCGKTVEVLDTDAEGRLILADALAYASQVYKPDLLLDFATLTGWAGTLHCDTSYVFYTENDKLGSQVFESGERMGERSIRMPNWPEYIEDTKSHIADLKNANYSACPGGGGFMATMFLSNFVKKKNTWIHFDLTHVDNKKSMNTCNGLQTIIDFLDMSFKKMIRAKET